ncbi:DoxX family protein [Dactylosporangium sp. AC04546]|uniref:DoxX family protein n=1 Tax=Dactylosporangium sp. AC04546 TaxID=2862460 RepID=UPI001EE002CE|nr:DoxX family protein [Dactylosporangium sp. AC04546]WVK86983.1 DoxX family protein [Dactylosporangium sp. AC04546]
MTAVDVGLLLVRLSLGGTMLMHGWNHWRGGGKIAGTARWFESIGLRNGRMQAWASVATELAAGIGFVLGLFTPLACASAVGTMTVAALIVHRKNGFFIFREGEGYEYVLMIIVMSIALALLGPGSISLDHALDITVGGGLGGIIAAVAGVGGALLLLTATYRPAKQT